MVQARGSVSPENSGRQLVLRIDNLRPIAVSDLGKALLSISADYRKEMGKELIVARLEGGSVVAFFQEAASYVGGAVDFAESANHLMSFVTNIAAITTMTLGSGLIAKKIFGTGGENGSKTVESLAKIAVSAGATVEFFGPNGGAPLVRITSADGKKIRRAARQNKKLKGAPAGNEDDLNLRIGMRAALIDAVRRGDVDSINLIAAFAKILKRHGLNDLLLEIAEELRREGYDDAAKILREAHRGSKSRKQPPLIEN